MSEEEYLMNIEHCLDETLDHILAGEAIDAINKLDIDEEEFDMKVHFHDEKTDDALAHELLELI